MSGNPISKWPVSERKRELLQYWERDNGKQDRPIWLNAAFRENDRKFTKFLIPLGKRVLELGCGSADLLASLDPLMESVSTSRQAPSLAPKRAIPA